MRELLCVLVIFFYFSHCMADPQWNFNFNKKKTEPKKPITKPKPPGPVGMVGAKKGGKVYSVNTNYNYVPPDLLKKLTKVYSRDDFIREFKPKGVTVTSVSGSRKTNVVRDVTGMSGGCTPRDQILPLAQPGDMSGSYWPSCVSVKQCGGCCPNQQFMECVPTQIKKVPHSAFYIKFSNFDVVPVSVDMFHHSKCACQCKVKKEDCYPKQTYDPNNCQCRCDRTVTDCSYGKTWSMRACGCVCSQRYECERGKVWNENSCKCACSSDRCPYGAARDPSTCLCVNVANGYPVHDANHGRIYDVTSTSKIESNEIDTNLYDEL